MKFNGENGWVVWRGDLPFHGNLALRVGIAKGLDGKSSCERKESEKSELGIHSFEVVRTRERGIINEDGW